MSSACLLPAVCPFCGCLCDDVQVEAGEGGLVKPNPTCARARSRLSELSRAPDRPQIDGQTVTWQQAYQETQRRLAAARSPLFLFGETVPGSAVHPALDLAQMVGAVVDSPLSAYEAGLVRAAAEIGTVSPSLGEVRDRADVVLLWGADLVQAHPRFGERFLGSALQRKIISLDGRLPEGISPQIERHVQPGERVLPSLVALRLALTGAAVETDASLTAIRQAVEGARYGVVLLGPGLIREGAATVQALFDWVQALNDRSGRWTALPVGEAADWTGLRDALLTEAGFPCAFHYGTDGAEFSLRAWSAEGLLRRGEVDFGLALGQVEWLSPLAAEGWRALPRVQISALPPAEGGGVWFPCATPGYDCGGSVLRMDGVPYRLDPWISGQRPAAEVVLACLMEGSPV